MKKRLAFLIAGVVAGTVVGGAEAYGGQVLAKGAGWGTQGHHGQDDDDDDGKGGGAACSSDAQCDDDNVCTTDKCKRGRCRNKAIHDDRPCDDGNACTRRDTCDDGVCRGKKRADGTACDDTVTCSGLDSCQAGVCTVPGALVQKIAFTTTRDNPNTLPQVLGAEVYLMNPDGTDLARLTANDVFSDAFPSLTPDGKGRIVFDSNRDIASTDPVNLVDLFLMKSDGSNQQYLVRGSSASWSPDSRRITFQRSASGTGLPINPLPGAPAADSDIFVASVCDLLAGEPPRNISNDPLMLKIDVDPDWSSDGLKIVFTNSDVGDHPQTPTSSEIWVMNADGSDPVQLTDNEVEERGPAWSPDGTLIAYSCKQGTVAPDADLEVCVMNANGSGQTQLTFNTLNDASPKFSPDGTKIVWNRGGGGTGGGNHIWVMNLDGSNPTQITFPPSGTNLFPDWGFVTQ